VPGVCQRPDDPFALVAWDHNGDLSVLEVLSEIEDHLGAKLKDDEWNAMFERTFGEVVDRLLELSAGAQP